MAINSNIIHFPNKLKSTEEYKKKKYISIRDDIENILKKYSDIYQDEWAVVLAAGRYSSMRLQQIEGSKKCIKFFKDCIETQESN